MSGAEGGLRQDHLDDSACADLVLGLAPAPARTAALAHATECPACEARLRAHVGAAERAAADAGQAAATGVVVRPAVPFWRRTGVLPLAAAAAFALAIALPLLRPQQAPHGTRWLPDPGELVRTRSAGGDDAHLAAGLRAYHARDLATAARELTVAHASGPAEQVRRLYLAQVLSESGDARGALALLRSLDWYRVPEPWRHDAAQLLAQALRADGHAAAADSIERALRSLPPGTPFVP